MATRTIEPQERRTAGVQLNGRAAQVVSKVLKATGEELNRVGYATMRMDEIAERAGVSKSTIYRRWPTKAELVIDLISNHFDEADNEPNTGSLRQDLINHGLHLLKLSKSPMWYGVLSSLTGRTEPEVDQLATNLRERAQETRKRIVQRSIDRGELSKFVDVEIICDMFAAPILRRLFTSNLTVDARYIEAITDTTLAGAAALATLKRA
ncbi:TetR/AcrR family transcriptional regulator [Zhongshania sp.]|uniref:TetR/AcrR family transcriptional regulator n=1 Tax=Zhongshania sp. TaxID=1971902 RepID=UPI0035614961